MNKFKYLILLISLLGTKASFSQYYYNDIIALQQSQKQYASLMAAHIGNVSAVSYEGNQPVDNFKLDQDISANGRTITITSNDPSSGNSITINTYENGRLVQTKDSTENVLAVTNYTYNTAGNIASITTSSDDAFMNSHSTETHVWSYNNNVPAQMLRIKDKVDTTLVTFTADAGNVAQETWKRKGKAIENYYYYYNGKNELTDIVRFNIRVRKMLPDFLFEYDDAGHISQIMQVPNGSSDYMVWKYTYNDKGLKQREMLYNKQQQGVGRIEYKYQ